MSSPRYHVHRGLRWIAVSVWALSKRFPMLHLLLFAAALAAGVLIASLGPRELPEHATALVVGGSILGALCLMMLVRAIIALVRGRWPAYCDREIERAREYYDPARFG